MRQWIALCVLVAAFAGSGCAGKSQDEQVVGKWHGTRHIKTSYFDYDQVTDLALDADHKFVNTYKEGGRPAQTSTGTWRSEPDGRIIADYGYGAAVVYQWQPDGTLTVTDGQVTLVLRRVK